MTAIGSYFTTAGPTVIAGMMVQAEARVRVGTSRFWASMEVTSAAYLARTASIGLQVAQSYDLGEVSSLGFEHVPTFGVPEAANVLVSSIETLEEEETTISIGIWQFDVRIIEKMVATGVMYSTGPGGNERQITVGGKCNTSRVPIEIAAENIGCNAPAAPGDVLNGVSAIIITAYDCQCTSGFVWSDIVSRELNVIDSEWNVKPVNTLALGNRKFNLYVY